MKSKPDPALCKFIWDTQVIPSTSRDAVLTIANTVAHLVSDLGPRLGGPAIRYPQQMLLEEVIKELQSRV